jgi:type I restriction enzyme M protein
MALSDISRSTILAEPTSPVIRNHAAFIWSVADLLRGDYKQSEYGRVILPLTVLRRLDCVLAPTKQQVLARAAKYGDRRQLLEAAAGQQFYNTSKYDFARLLAAPDDLADNLKHYIASFSPGARDVLDKFGFDTQITRLDRSNLLYLVVSKFADLDLHPDAVSNLEMGYLYEELIRRFSELSNETAGEHFTPREVIRLMVNLLFIEDADLLTKPGISKTILDPACGTGGMLSVAEDYLREHNPSARLHVYGQELNAETYAICRSDMMLKGQDATNIAYGNSFSEDGHVGLRADYAIANPPFGVEWKKVADPIRDEAASKGFAGRFGAGLPRINDGSFLFLQHMIAKMKPAEQGGSRVAIVFNGSPLFTGAAGSGESEIRRWIIENDWLEAVVALPDQLFYNTGISTYFWVVTNRKRPERRGKVQLVDARAMWTKMRKSLGEKRKQIADAQIDDIVRAYGDFTDTDHPSGVRVKVFPNEAFGFLRITVERPLRVRWEVTDDTLAAVDADPKVAKLDDPTRAALRDGLEKWRGEAIADPVLADKRVAALMSEADVKGKPLRTAILDALAVRDPDAEPVTDTKGNVMPDPDLRDNENVALPPVSVTHEADPTARLRTLEYRTAIDRYLEAEVHPYVPDAWVDHDKTKIGYEIPLTRHFYTYVPPRPLEEIDAEIKQLEAEIQDLLREVTDEV